MILLLTAIRLSLQVAVGIKFQYFLYVLALDPQLHEGKMPFYTY
jgi:hypothetical protein